jgi:hypothetical protein
MKSWLLKSLALCAFLAVLTFTGGCGGGGGGGSQGSSPEANNLSARRASGISFDSARPVEGSRDSAYETLEPGTLSMLLSSIAGAGVYFIARRMRRQ